MFELGLVITLLALLSSVFDPYPRRMTCAEYLLAKNLTLDNTKIL